MLDQLLEQLDDDLAGIPARLQLDVVLLGVACVSVSASVSDVDGLADRLGDQFENRRVPPRLLQIDARTVARGDHGGAPIARPAFRISSSVSSIIVS